jgi:malonyl-CoA decarboxylase
MPAMLEKLDERALKELGRAVGFEPPTTSHVLGAADQALQLDANAPVRRLLKQSAAHYLAKEVQNGKPLDPVARFHLGNGARVERLNWAGDPSAKGLQQSYGLMVNYLYDLQRLDKNRALLLKGTIPVSKGIEDLCP